MRHLEPDKREEWDAMLVDPLPGARQPTPAQVEDEGESFMALMGAVKKGPGNAAG